MTTRIKIAVGILVIFHMIGLVLFIYDGSNSRLSWLNMLVCGVILLLNEKKIAKSALPLIFIFVGGILIEWIGTTRGWLFGNYSYGDSLGPKVLGVPPMIGLNWVCIILASVSTANLFLGNAHKLLTAAVAAFLAVLMDYLIEPVAIQFGMWSWENNVIPLYNYICWFIFSLLFSWIYLRKASGTNQPARYLYLIWAAFFLSIQLIL